MENTRTLARYKQNLKIGFEFVYSYNTKVARFDRENGTLVALGYWSATTSKHISYVASQFGLKVVKGY